MDYQEQVEDALGTFQHSSLRTCFDPYAHEWGETSLAEKALILRKCSTHGLDVEDLVRGYVSEYLKIKGNYAVKDTYLALARILNHVFLEENSQNPFLK